MARGRAGSSAAEGTWGSPSREDGNARIRVEGRHGEPPHRTHGEPLGPNAHRGRLERRERGGGGAGHGAVERWNRRWRLDQDSGCLLRHSWPETHVWAGSLVAGEPVRDALSCRTDGPDGAR